MAQNKIDHSQIPLIHIKGGYEEQIPVCITIWNLFPSRKPFLFSLSLNKKQDQKQSPLLKVFKNKEKLKGGVEKENKKKNNNMGFVSYKETFKVEVGDV